MLLIIYVLICINYCAQLIAWKCAAAANFFPFIFPFFFTPFIIYLPRLNACDLLLLALFLLLILVSQLDTGAKEMTREKWSSALIGLYKENKQQKGLTLANQFAVKRQAGRQFKSLPV